MLLKVMTIMCVGVVAACGAHGPGPNYHNDADDQKQNNEFARPTISPADSDMHTPGFFRDLHRVLLAQSRLEAATALERWRIELPARLAAINTVPPMAAPAKDTLISLLYLAVRAVQSASDRPDLACAAAEVLVAESLGLDPIFLIMPNGPSTEWGAGTIARLALASLEGMAGAQVACAQPLAQATWTPTDPSTIWVPPSCSSGYTIQGYCAGDTWVDQTCYDQWVCKNGRWDYGGRYEWVCRGDECDYEWVPTQVWVPLDCDRGHWETVCYGGYWESGVCYENIILEPICTEGYELTVYGDGFWTFEAQPQDLDNCQAIRPAQLEVTRSALLVLAQYFADDLPPGWSLALDMLAEETNHFEVFQESQFAGALDIFQAAAN